VNASDILDTSLKLTCQNGHLEVAKFLVDKGGNIHASHYIYQFLVRHRIIKN